MEKGFVRLGGGSSKSLLETISNERIESEIGDKWVWKIARQQYFQSSLLTGF